MCRTHPHPLAVLSLISVVSCRPSSAVVVSSLSTRGSPGRTWPSRKIKVLVSIPASSVWPWTVSWWLLSSVIWPLIMSHLVVYLLPFLFLQCHQVLPITLVSMSGSTGPAKPVISRGFCWSGISGGKTLIREALGSWLSRGSVKSKPA